MKHLFLIAALLCLGGCTKHIVRDAKVYRAELAQYDAWATRQANLIKGFMPRVCTCDATMEFTTKECRDAADFVLTIQTRSEWHRLMSLYLAGINEDRPPKDPPPIPASRTLCPNYEGGE